MIQRYPDAEAVCRAAADDFVRLSRAAVAARGRFPVAPSGGSTPKRLFKVLATAPYRDQVDWPRVEFFWGDERTVPPTDPESNFHTANEGLLKPLAIAPAHIHRMQAERPDREAAA